MESVQTPQLLGVKGSCPFEGSRGKPEQDQSIENRSSAVHVQGRGVRVPRRGRGVTVWGLSSEAAESGPGWPRWGSTTEDGHCVILSKRPQTDRKEDTTVAVVKSMDLVAAIREQLATASPDVLRELLEAFVNVLMSAEADAVCGAPYGKVSPERVNRRNGYRDRPFDTRVGSIELRIPKLRSASYFPDWLLERRKRAETALTTVVATCDLSGS
jgi:hypothetical protein